MHIALGIAVIALGVSCWAARIAFQSRRISDDAELRINECEEFLADCINPDGDALIVTLVR